MCNITADYVLFVLNPVFTDDFIEFDDDFIRCYRFDAVVPCIQSKTILTTVSIDF